ncbi:MAG: SDR family oxidoreductase [Gammaproteobacteria bacterium]|nr:MAG: SDR family oxidoreductase [Gammaproteobacteria bacterium]
MKLRDKNVLITGGAGGIGSAIAREMLSAGAAVMLVDRDPEALERTAGNLAAEPQDRLATITCDLTDCRDLERLRREARDWRGGVDVLINAAGVNHFGLFIKQSPAQLEQTLAINVLAPMKLCHVLLPNLLKKPEAAVLNIGSVFGSIGYPGYAAYAASKFAVRGFTESLRRELADTQVSFHCIAPRATRTGINSAAVDAMNEALGNHVDSPDAVARAVCRTLEKGRGFAVVGWPEKLFARLNALLPGIVERAIVRQLPLIRKCARSQGESPPGLATRMKDGSNKLRSQAT